MRSHSTTNATPPTETLTGIVERITFHSEESGYTVARFKLPKTDNLTTIIGNFANIQAGQMWKSEIGSQKSEVFLGFN